MLISEAILDECKELPVVTLDGLQGKWPCEGGDFWDHTTEDGKRLCWEILAGTSATAPKVIKWLRDQEELPGFRSSGDMKSAAAAHEKAVIKAGQTIAHWSETQKVLRDAEKAAAAEAKAEAPSKAADTGTPAPEAPAPKPARKQRAKQPVNA